VLALMLYYSVKIKGAGGFVHELLQHRSASGWLRSTCC
jgi:F0F1-type ATP synthase membrane subunit a